MQIRPAKKQRVSKKTNIPLSKFAKVVKKNTPFPPEVSRIVGQFNGTDTQFLRGDLIVEKQGVGRTHGYPLSAYYVSIKNRGNCCKMLRPGRFTTLKSRVMVPTPADVRGIFKVPSIGGRVRTFRRPAWSKPNEITLKGLEVSTAVSTTFDNMLKNVFVEMDDAELINQRCVKYKVFAFTIWKVTKASPCQVTVKEEHTYYSFERPNGIYSSTVKLRLYE